VHVFDLGIWDLPQCVFLVHLGFCVHQSCRHGIVQAEAENLTQGPKTPTDIPVLLPQIWNIMYMTDRSQTSTGNNHRSAAWVGDPHSGSFFWKIESFVPFSMLETAQSRANQRSFILIGPHQMLTLTLLRASIPSSDCRRLCRR
jgi:hypothetical protein